MCALREGLRRAVGRGASEYWPAFTMMIAGADGSLWLKHGQPIEEGRIEAHQVQETWLHVDEFGRRNQVWQPVAGVTVLDIEGDISIGRRTDELGVQYLQFYRLESEGRMQPGAW